MADELKCYRCGASLGALSLPLSRQDMCPGCSVYLHVCRMCEFYDPAVPKQCREDDAEEVLDKEKLNFCDWFRPGYEVFDPARAHQQQKAKEALAELFGEGESDKPSQNAPLSEAEKLFK